MGKSEKRYDVQLNKRPIKKHTTRSVIPVTFRTYFWDVDWEDVRVHTEKYRDFIITRLADKGDWEEVRWLKDVYGLDRIGLAVSDSRSVSLKTKRFWECFGNSL